MAGHHFISYSSVDGFEFALRLADEIVAGPPPFEAWLDKRELQAGQDWDTQIVDAIRTCDSFLFLMTRESVEDLSISKQEWVRALKYKKPILPLLLHTDAEIPFRLGTRQHIDFTGSFERGMAQLRIRLRQLSQPEGILQAQKDRRADAQRDLHREANPLQQERIQEEINQLNIDIHS